MQICSLANKSHGVATLQPIKSEESRPKERLSCVRTIILSLLYDKLDSRKGLTIALDSAEIDPFIEVGNRKAQLSIEGIDFMTHHLLSNKIVNHSGRSVT